IIHELLHLVGKLIPAPILQRVWPEPFSGGTVANVTAYAVLHLKQVRNLTLCRYIEGVTAETADLGLGDVLVAEPLSHVTPARTHQDRIGLSVFILRPPGGIFIEAHEVGFVVSGAFEMTVEAVPRAVVFRRGAGSRPRTRRLFVCRLRGA